MSDISFNSTEKVNVPDVLGISRQLEELRLLKDGWLDGAGLAPSHDGLDWLSQAFDNHYSEKLPLPYLYPTVEGDVQIEWSLKPNEVTLRIDLGSCVGKWHMLNAEIDTDTSRTLNLDNPEDWAWIRNQIQLTTPTAATPPVPRGSCSNPLQGPRRSST